MGRKMIALARRRGREVREEMEEVKGRRRSSEGGGEINGCVLVMVDI